MKIYTIFTGGTIGSRLDERGRITVRESVPYRLLNMYRNLDKDTQNGAIEFVAEEPYCILSENLAADNLCRLIQCVRRVIGKGDADGIVITHGTDTLQYSAAIIGYVFGGAKLPIVLVSADYPLEYPQSNGLDNFRYAVKFIQGRYGNGVFVSYCNKGDVPTIHRGTRLLQHLPLSADVCSVCGMWYGRFYDGIYMGNREYRFRKGMDAIAESAEGIKLDEFSGIMRITPYVGMSYPQIAEGTKVILHESFHSGTIAINKELRKFADSAGERGIPIFLSGLSEGEAEYETVSFYREMDIRPLPESAPVSQYCKLWLITSNGLDVDKMMKMSVAEDFV